MFCLRGSVKDASSKTKSLRFLRKTHTAPETSQRLSWPEYLAIRRSKRKWELAATIPTTALGLGLGATYFGSLESDATKPIMGIEPIWVYAAATICCAGLGYLTGPFIGNSLWRMTHRKNLKQIDLRDKEFHDRIVRKRVDPSNQSAYNPVPDYYGEKIGSLSGYRQWLRDQAKYRRKASWE